MKCQDLFSLKTNNNNKKKSKYIVCVVEGQNKKRQINKCIFSEKLDLLDIKIA